MGKVLHVQQWFSVQADATLLTPTWPVSLNLLQMRKCSVIHCGERGNWRRHNMRSTAGKHWHAVAPLAAFLFFFSKTIKKKEKGNKGTFQARAGHFVSQAFLLFSNLCSVLSSVCVCVCDYLPNVREKRREEKEAQKREDEWNNFLSEDTWKSRL